jgi:hypothetical protein
MSSSNHRDKAHNPALLFWIVLPAVLGGIAAFSTAHDQAPSYALDSNLIYRMEIGLATLAVLYVVGVALWLAWHGKGFFELSVAGAGIKAAGAEDVEEAAGEIEESDEAFQEWREQAEETFEEMDQRLQQIESPRRGPNP